MAEIAWHRRETIAFWRHGDDDAYAAYRKLIHPDPHAG
jgi:hypothetical protein